MVRPWVWRYSLTNVGFLVSSVPGRFAYIDTEWTRIGKTLEAAEQAHPKATIPPIAAPAKAPIPATPIVRLKPSVPVQSPLPSTPTPAAPPRPIIKLRVGSMAPNGSPAPPSASLVSTPKGTLKPKQRKPKEPKLSEVPPPPPAAAPPAPEPDFDDGSLDLLEEVIAIEREQDEVRHRKHRTTPPNLPEKERAREKQVVPKLVIGGKRKKPILAMAPDGREEEDEILALATPSKKERSAPSSPPIPGPSTARPSSTEKGASHSGTPTPAPPPTRNGVGNHKKSKEKALRSAPPLMPQPPPPVPEPVRDAPRPSNKGKEKETPMAASSSKKRSPPVTMIPINEKKCRDILKALVKLPDARIFLQPVDPVRDGCPT